MTPPSRPAADPRLAVPVEALADHRCAEWPFAVEPGRAEARPRPPRAADADWLADLAGAYADFRPARRPVDSE